MVFDTRMLGAIGRGLMTGGNTTEQIAGALGGIGEQRRVNRTVEFLQKENPEIAQAIDQGMISVGDGYAMHLKGQMEKQKAASPENRYKAVGGHLYDMQTGNWMAPPQTAEAPKPTSLMVELEAAGLQPGTPEYQRAIMEANKPKGMMLESDGQGGFRMVQGSNIDAMPNLNVEQGKNTGFLLRAQDSNQKITQFENEGTSSWNKVMNGLPGGIGNHAVSSEAQQLQQAKRDFINAVLRQESGAVISPEEFANAEQQYFPQPGDGPEVIAQKRANRENAIAGFRIRSGPGSGVADQMKQQGGVTDYTDYFK